MATLLYDHNGGGGSRWFQAKSVARHLAAGWSPVPKPQEEPPTEDMLQEGHEAPEKAAEENMADNAQGAETGQGGAEAEDGDATEPQAEDSVPDEPEGEGPKQYTEDEIRAMAKDRGIKNYWNRRLDGLVEELGL
jgi:hypothetical protein